MALNRNRNTSDFGQVEGSHFGSLDGLRLGNLSIFDGFSGDLTGEFFGTFTVCSRSMFTGTFNGESFTCSKKTFRGTVFEGRFVGYFEGNIERDILDRDTYHLGGGFSGKLTGRFVGGLDNLSNAATRNAVTQADYPISTVYNIPIRSIIPNPSVKKGEINGKVYGGISIDRETFDKFGEMVQSPLQLDNLKGTFNISGLAKFSGTFNDKEFVQAIRTFNGTVHNGLFNGKLMGFNEIERFGAMVCLSGTFSGNLVGNFVGSLDGVVSNRAVIV